MITEPSYCQGPKISRTGDTSGPYSGPNKVIEIEEV